MSITAIRTEQGRCGHVLVIVVAVGLSAPAWSVGPGHCRISVNS